MNQKKFIYGFRFKFHVTCINNPNWSNFIIIYGFHGFPLYQFDRFNTVCFMVALTGFIRYFICRVVLKKLMSSTFVSYCFTILSYISIKSSAHVLS